MLKSWYVVLPLCLYKDISEEYNHVTVNFIDFGSSADSEIAQMEQVEVSQSHFCRDSDCRRR